MRVIVDSKATFTSMRVVRKARNPGTSCTPVNRPYRIMPRVIGG